MSLQRRRVERFSIQLPARISLSNNGHQGPIEGVTRNISSCGVLVQTTETLDVGAHVDVDLLLSFQKLKKTSSKQSRIKVSGLVLRAEENALAICFDEEYQIFPVNSIDSAGG